MARVSIFIGGIKPLPKSGLPTGMYKSPIAGAVELGHEGFAGDQQGDRRVHGGPEKAVHLYPARHYERLAARFPEAAASLVAGSLGENLSTEDLDERDVRIGDIWALGSTQLQACQLRKPCWKIDERFSSDGMMAYIDENLLTGWYFRVIRPGQVCVGDSLDLLQAATNAPTLHEALLLWQEERPSLSELEQLAQTPGIASAWKDKINQRLAYLRTVD